MPEHREPTLSPPTDTSAPSRSGCRPSAQTPVINPGGIVNNASYIPLGLPNSGIAQGSMFILKGNPFGLCNANPANNVVIANSFPLNTIMRNVQVRIHDERADLQRADDLRRRMPRQRPRPDRGHSAFERPRGHWNRAGCVYEHPS